MKTPSTLAAFATLVFFVNTSEGSIIFDIGINNNSTSEMEQEGGGRNNSNFYWENEDYTGLTGLNGSGQNWTSGPEPLVSGATIQGEPAGFPRAVTTGFPTTNIFFQIDPSEVLPENRFLMEIDVLGGKAGTTHDLEFLLNGNVFHSVNNRNTSPGIISAVVNPHALGVGAGPAVLSYRRTGGVRTGAGAGSAWIIWDKLTLTAVVPEPTSALTLWALVGILSAAHRRRRKVNS